MRTRALISVAVLTAATAATAVTAGTAGAATAPHARKTVEGKFSKRVGMDNFDMTAMHTTYLVKTDAMTHVTEGGMKTSVAKFKKGWLLTVKGTEGAMHTIRATSIAVDKM